MSGLVAIYARGWSIGSLLIRNADSGKGSRWSHCGILTPEQTVIEAQVRHGVTETPLAEFLARYSRVQQVQVHCLRPDRGISWARSQIGKGYDYLGVLGNWARESWEDESRWHCAELLEAALVKAGRRRFRDAPWLIRPNHSFMVT